MAPPPDQLGLDASRPHGHAAAAWGGRRLFKRIVFIGAAVLLGLIVLGMFAMRRDEARVAAFTASAPAEVTGVSVRSDPDSSADTTVVDYRFTAAGEARTGQVSKPGDVRTQFAKGVAATVCYDPAAPDRSEIHPTGHACGDAPGTATTAAAPPKTAAPGSSEMSATDLDMITD